MSQQPNQDAKSQTPLEQAEASKNKPEVNAGTNTPPPPPDVSAEKELATTGETDAEKIAKAVDAVYKLNPSLTIEAVMDIVLKAFKKEESPDMKVAKEVARLIPPVPNTDIKKRIYLKQDKKRQFPLDETALDGVIVRQTYVRKTEEGDEITVPARNLNEIAVYSKEDFDRLSKPGFGFEREGVTVEVWHKPGDKNTVQAED